MPERKIKKTHTIFYFSQGLINFLFYLLFCFPFLNFIKLAIVLYVFNLALRSPSHFPCAPMTDYVGCINRPPCPPAFCLAKENNHQLLRTGLPQKNSVHNSCHVGLFTEPSLSRLLPLLPLRLRVGKSSLILDSWDTTLSYVVSLLPIQLCKQIFYYIRFNLLNLSASCFLITS